MVTIAAKIRTDAERAHNVEYHKSTWNITCQQDNNNYFLYGARSKGSRELHLMATVDPSRPAIRRPTCLLCLQVIEAKERLLLHNSSGRHVIPVLE